MILLCFSYIQHSIVNLDVFADETTRNLYYQQQTATELTKQLNQMISSLTSVINLYLNIGQNSTMNTSQVFMSLQTASVQSLANQQIQQVGGKIFYGGQIYKQRKGNYVQPTIITDIQHNTPIVQQETFVPILYVLKCKVKHSFVNSIRLCFLFCLVI